MDILHTFCISKQSSKFAKSDEIDTSSGDSNMLPCHGGQLRKRKAEGEKAGTTGEGEGGIGVGRGPNQNRVPNPV